jgi:hypothetical protein
LFKEEAERAGEENAGASALRAKITPPTTRWPRPMLKGLNWKTMGDSCSQFIGARARNLSGWSFFPPHRKNRTSLARKDMPLFLRFYLLKLKSNH